MTKQPHLPPLTHILVDDREARSEVTKALKKTNGVVVAVQRLPVGDYQIDGRLVVERKTLADLAESIKSERLFQQASRLASSPIRGALILEGTAEELRSSQMRREAIQGALITVTIVLGIPLLRARDARESANLLLYAGQQIRRMPTRAFPRNGKRPRGKRKLQVHILQGLPGVGPERASRLLDMFGNVEAVICTREHELARVDGIGLRTAQRIRWAVGV